MNKVKTNTKSFTEKKIQSQKVDPAAFFSTGRLTFTRAALSFGGPTDFYYNLGGYTIRLRFAGAALIPLITPALAHLEQAPVPEPALTVFLWDSRSTHTHMPSPPWKEEDYREFGLIRGFNNDRIKTVHQSALHMIDLDRNEAIYWIPDARQVPHFHTITPLRTIFHWWLSTRQRYIVHAAAVGIPEAGVLITGKGGAGKSTTALSCITAGLQYVGDENCIITYPPEPYVFSIYSSGTLEPQDVDKIPALKASLTNPEKLHEQKAVYQLFRDYQAHISQGFPVKAVFVPKVTGKRETTVTKRSAAQTLMALAPGSIFQLPGAGKQTLHAMAALLRSVPCFTLELGTNLSQIPVVIEYFLRNNM